MFIVAVDPGPNESAYTGWDGEKIRGFAKERNDFFLRPGFEGAFPSHAILVLEKVCCYGMPVGAEVFETVFFSGRLAQLWSSHIVQRVPRKDVKLHLCGNARAKDSNIVQALKDRFGDKGTKSNPGFFYGFSKDVWQSFALAVTYFDLANAR